MLCASPLAGGQKGEESSPAALGERPAESTLPVTADGSRGNLKCFQCPYHLWTYELDGKLQGAPFMEDNKAFDKQRISLPEFRMEVWNGIVFVNFDDDAAPLAPRLEGLAPDLRFCDRDDLVNPISEAAGYRQIEEIITTWPDSVLRALTREFGEEDKARLMRVHRR